MHGSKQVHFILHVPFPIGEGWQQIWRTALDSGGSQEHMKYRPIQGVISVATNIVSDSLPTFCFTLHIDFKRFVACVS